jgi:hypothetical protein
MVGRAPRCFTFDPLIQWVGLPLPQEGTLKHPSVDLSLRASLNSLGLSNYKLEIKKSKCVFADDSNHLPIRNRSILRSLENCEFPVPKKRRFDGRLHSLGGS